MKTVTKKLSELRHPERNIRMHPDKQIREFIRSLDKFGQTRPFVIDENNVVLVGNGMLEAMLARGDTEGACIIKLGLSDKEKKQLMMSDNKIFNLGMDDMDAFDALLHELDGDLDIPGYNLDMLTTLMAESEDIDGIVTEYGIVPEHRAEEIRSHERDDADEPNEAVATPSAAPTDMQTGETTPTRSFVICPKCGEKIWL